jgi:hypothetical protein
VGNDVYTANVYFTGGGDHPGRQHAGSGRLPGTVWPEQAKDLAGVHGEIQPVDGCEIGTWLDLGELRGPDDLTADAQRKHGGSCFVDGRHGGVSFPARGGDYFNLNRCSASGGWQRSNVARDACTSPLDRPG